MESTGPRRGKHCLACAARSCTVAFDDNRLDSDEMSCAGGDDGDAAPGSGAERVKCTPETKKRMSRRLLRLMQVTDDLDPTRLHESDRAADRHPLRHDLFLIVSQVDDATTGVVSAGQTDPLPWQLKLAASLQSFLQEADCHRQGPARRQLSACPPRRPHQGDGCWNECDSVPWLFHACHCRIAARSQSADESFRW